MAEKEAAALAGLSACQSFWFQVQGPVWALAPEQRNSHLHAFPQQAYGQARCSSLSHCLLLIRHSEELVSVQSPAGSFQNGFLSFHLSSTSSLSFLQLGRRSINKATLPKCQNFKLFATSLKQSKLREETFSLVLHVSQVF